MGEVGRIEVLHEHPAYHPTIMLRCRCGQVMDVFCQETGIFVLCRNCGRGYYIASPEGCEKAKARWNFAIQKIVEKEV